MPYNAKCFINLSLKPQIVRDNRSRNVTHIHAHVPGLSLAQIFFWSHNFETVEHIPVLFPEVLNVLLVVNLLSRQPILMY